MNLTNEIIANKNFLLKDVEVNRENGVVTYQG